MTYGRIFCDVTGLGPVEATGAWYLRVRYSVLREQFTGSAWRMILVDPCGKRGLQRVISLSGLGVLQQPSLKDLIAKGEVTYVNEEDADVACEKYEQLSLLIGAMLYRNRIYYAFEDERKTCICPGGGLVTCLKKSPGMSWIGVNRIDTTCVVTANVVTRKCQAGKRQLGTTPVLETTLADIVGGFGVGHLRDTKTKGKQTYVGRGISRYNTTAKLEDAIRPPVRVQYLYDRLVINARALDSIYELEDLNNGAKQGQTGIYTSREHSAQIKIETE
ncbi:hypothetical protein OROMI_026381 [Orobanche minor]